MVAEDGVIVDVVPETKYLELQQRLNEVVAAATNMVLRVSALRHKVDLFGKFTHMRGIASLHILPPMSEFILKKVLCRLEGLLPSEHHST